MSDNELRCFIFEKYYKWIGYVIERNYHLVKCFFKKDLLLLPTKLIEIPDSCNVKKHYKKERKIERKKQKKDKKEKQKISKTTRNNYLSIKDFWKLKHYWYKISY